MKIWRQKWRVVVIVILVHLVNQNSEMSDSSMESCSSEDDISCRS